MRNDNNNYIKPVENIDPEITNNIKNDGNSFQELKERIYQRYLQELKGANTESAKHEAKERYEKAMRSLDIEFNKPTPTDTPPTPPADAGPDMEMDR